MFKDKLICFMKW